MRGRGLIAALALGASAAAGQAAACSYANSYAADAVRTPAATYAEAASVDWVRIEPPPPALCGRPPAWVEDEDALDRAWEAYQAQCAAAVARDGKSAPFTAAVVERLKGASPERFTLVYDRQGDGSWEEFSDLRSVGWEGHLFVGLSEKATADGRHRSDRFWQDGDLGPSTDLSHSCGGWPTLDPRMRYVAFRDAHGGVIALEPVLHDDDELLARLRRARTEPDALVRRLPAADFFRSAQRMVVVRVRGCDRRWEDVDARLLRGDADAFPREAYQDDPGGGGSRLVRVEGIDVDVLHDWFVWTGARCGGQTLLVVEHPGPGAAAGELDWAYGYEPVPEARGSKLAQWFEERGLDLRGRYLPRVVAVRDGKVRLADLSPAAPVEGPPEVTLDEAFAWFEAGRAGR